MSQYQYTSVASAIMAGDGVSCDRGHEVVAWRARVRACALVHARRCARGARARARGACVVGRVRGGGVYAQTSQPGHMLFYCLPGLLYHCLPGLLGPSLPGWACACHRTKGGTLVTSWGRLRVYPARVQPCIRSSRIDVLSIDL